MTELVRLPDAHAAAEHAAREITRLLATALAARGIAHLSLAGGTTPRIAYNALPELVASWEGVNLWFGDERCVPPEDPDSNYRMVAESLLADERTAAAVVHRIRGELGPEPAAQEYSAALGAGVAAGDDGVPVLDVSLLGLGEDGHTASLFPGHPELRATGAFALPVHDAPKPPPERVTLSLPVLRAARRTLLLTPGAGKREALAKLLRGPDPSVPASLLASDRLEAIADEAAAP